MKTDFVTLLALDHIQEGSVELTESDTVSPASSVKKILKEASKMSMS